MDGFSVLAIVLAAFFFITTCILSYYVLKFARIIFVIEDDLSEFNNRLVDTLERLEEVQRIRVLLTHPTANKYVMEAFEELRYCQYVILETVRKSKLLIKKDYSTNIQIDKDFPKLLNRLENDGTYDAMEDGGINVIPVEEIRSR